MVMEAMTSSVFKASRNNSQFTIPGPGVESVTPTSSSGTTTYLRFPSPPPRIPKSHSLAKDWQWSAPWEAGGIAALQIPALGARITSHCSSSHPPCPSPKLLSLKDLTETSRPRGRRDPAAFPASALACQSTQHYLRARPWAFSCLANRRSLLLPPSPRDRNSCTGYRGLEAGALPSAG